MSSLKSYMDNKELRYSVTIGRKTFKGYRTAKEALAAGVAHAQNEDSRASSLLIDKPLDRQVGIVFGAEVMQKHFPQPV